MKRAAYLGLLLVAFILPWEDAVRLPVLGSLGRASGLIFMMLAVPALMHAHRLRFRLPSLFLMFLLCFVLWSGLSIYWSLDPASTITHIFSRLQVLVLIWLAWQLLETPEKALPVMFAYILGCWVATGTAAANWFAGNEFVYQRYSAIGTDPNDFATLMALGIPLVWRLLLRYGRGLVAWFLLLYFPLVVIALLLTSSRGGALVAALGMLVVPLTFRQLRPSLKWLVGGFAVLLVAGAAVAAPFMAETAASSLARLSSTASEVSSGTLNERSDLWQAGLTLFNDAGLLGVGAGAFEHSVAAYVGAPNVAHNTYISVLVELGPLGLLLFLCCIVAAGLPLVRSGPEVRFPMLVLLLVLAVGLLPLTWETRKTTYFMMMLATTQGTVILLPSAHRTDGNRDTGRRTWLAPRRLEV